MRTPLLALCLTAVAGCSGSHDAPIRLSLLSRESLDNLSMCIAQNWEGALPRMFPVSRSGGSKAFRAYNGIEVEISPRAAQRGVLVRSTEDLSLDEVRYLHRCADGAFNR